MGAPGLATVDGRAEIVRSEPSRRDLAVAAELRRLVRRLHRVLRDGDGDSSIVERFDELTKLLCCKAWDERSGAGDPAAGAPRGCAAQVGASAPSVTARAAAVRARFARIVEARPGLFPPRFRQLGLGDETIARVAELLAPAVLEARADAGRAAGAPDLGGLAYEELVRDTFDKGDNQQFFTPPGIVDLLVTMTGARLRGRVCDPACGTGGFLLGVLDRLQAQGRAAEAELVGLEIDERLAWAARISLELHGAPRYHVAHVDGAGSLGSAAVAAHRGRYDVVLTNPPFGSDLVDAAALAGFELGRGRSSRRRGILFLERCLELVRPGGLIGIVLDEGVLNAATTVDVRRLVQARARLLAVVSLPETAFMPYATVKTSAVLLERRAPGDPAGDPACFFARAHEIGRRPNGAPLHRVSPVTGRLELDDDLPAIMTAWARFAADHECPPCPPEARAEWFAAPLAVPPARRSSRKRRPLDAAADPGLRLDFACHHPARRQAARALSGSRHPLRALGELCANRNQPLVPAVELADDEVVYLGLSGMEAGTGRCHPTMVPSESVKSAALRFEPGDVLFSRMRPELRKVCVAPCVGYASAECLVLVPRRDGGGAPAIDPELLALLLRSDLAYGQIVHLVTGIGRPRIARAAVLAIQLPVPTPAEQAGLLAEVARGEGEAALLLADAARLARSAHDLCARTAARLLEKLGL